MKIGFVIYDSLDTVSGGYLYDRKLVQYLRAKGDTVEVISLPWRNYVSHLTDNFRFRLPNGFDILIQDELNHPSQIAANRNKHPYPVISLVHHLRCSELRAVWQNHLYRIVEKKYLRSVDGFIFNSKTTQSVVQGLIGDVKPSVAAYPPTDRFGEAISEEEIRERAISPKFRILFLGNVIYRKGLHTLLEALRLQTLDFRLDVVGSLSSEPKYAEAMQKRAEELGIKAKVFFHGALDQAPLVQLLRRAHVLVVPSSYEGYGIAYLEGMCFGLPAIGTTAGAAGEIISDEVDGFLIQPEGTDSLANRLKVLNEKRNDLARMSLAARERYLRQPKWEETARQIREFLISVIEKFGG